MKPTCPSCGAKDAHEKIVSTVRTWFRCNACSFVWRGSVLAFAYEGSPLGSSREAQTAEVPVPAPLPPARPLGGGELDAALDAVDRQLESPSVASRPAEPVAPADPGGDTLDPATRGHATPAADVETWLGLAPAAAAKTAREATSGDTGRAPADTPRATDDDPGTLTNAASLAADLADLIATRPADEPSAPAPTASEAATAETHPPVGGLAETLRRLAVFDAELAHVKQRLGKSDATYSAVVKRWEPLVGHPTDGPSDDDDD